MALRVLLADESSTIKKVFQLALQDFAVEVRSVNIGIDVASVARTFKPDIIFADVLLQKKNGYDVCAELKADAGLKIIPVVLMWSGFMELDEDKFQAAQANEQLEKPFDVAALRKLVTALVPRTQNQKLSQFLTFPKSQAEAEKNANLEENTPIPESEEEFQQVSIPKMKGGNTDKYRLDLKPEELEPGHIAVDYEMPSDKMEVDDIFKPSEASDHDEFQMRESTSKTGRSFSGSTVVLDEEDLQEIKTDEIVPMPIAPARSPGENRTAPPPVQALSPEQLEAIIREQSQEVIEAVVWKVVPELAKQIIERELNKLLQERDSHPY